MDRELKRRKADDQAMLQEIFGERRGAAEVKEIGHTFADNSTRAKARKYEQLGLADVDPKWVAAFAMRSLEYEWEKVQGIFAPNPGLLPKRKRVSYWVSKVCEILSR